MEKTYRRGLGAFTGLCFALLCIFVFPSLSYAGPACPFPATVEQPDGTVIGAVIHGDEFRSWTTTDDGYTVVPNAATGYWEYARQNADSTLAPSGTRVTPSGAVPSGLKKNLMPPRDTERENQFDEQLRARQRARIGSAKTATVWTPKPLSGTRNLLVVRVAFAGDSAQAFNSAIMRDDWNGVLFTGMKSIARYYQDNSQGLVSISAVSHTQSSVAGIIDVTINMQHPWYKNRSTDAEYNSEVSWLSAALAQITSGGFLNIASYDANSDGTITPDELSIHFVAAGYEYSSGASSQRPSVWGHSWSSVTGNPLYPPLTAGVPAKIISDWSLSGEMNASGVMMPVGVVIHELGHLIFALPDLYDVSYYNGGLGFFSLMSMGSWGYDIGEYPGTTPVALDAWSRQYVGWAAPRDLPANGNTITFPRSLSGSASPVKLCNSSISTTEYFLSENRGPSGWDQGLRGWFGSNWGGGLLVLHCDTDVGSGSLDVGNDINNYDKAVISPGTWGHQGIMAEDAGQTGGSYGNAATFFYSGNVDSFTLLTTPGSNYYSGAMSFVGLTGISAPGDTMTAVSCALSVIVLSPNGGEEWRPGTVENITWASSDISNVKLEYSLGDSIWTTVVASTPADTETYAWTIPDTTSTNCFIRISDAADPTAYDVSDGAFTLTRAAYVTLADTPWPMFGQNPRHTGLGVNTVPASSTVKWKYKTGKKITWSSPVIGYDSTIYVGSEDSCLYALKKDGTLRWKYRTGGQILSSAVLGSDGTIYFGSADSCLYAITSDGTFRWKYTTGESIASSPLIGSNGIVYVGSTDDYLYAVNTNGILKWKYKMEYGVYYSSPAIGDDGVVYVNGGGYLYAITANGVFKWKLFTSNDSSSPAVGNDGTVYAKGYGDLYAITSDGKLKWDCTLSSAPSLIGSSPAIGIDGTVYVPERYLYATASEGTLKWKYNTADSYPASPVIGSDGTVYAGWSSGYLRAVTSDGIPKWTFKTGGDVYSSPAIDADGTLYVGSGDSCLYAFAPVTAFVTVSSPNGGEKWVRGTAHDITWNATGTVDTLKIGLYKDGGATFVRNIVTSTPNTGSYSWTIPTDIPDSSDYRIRITALSDTSVWDHSDADLAVTLSDAVAETPSVFRVTPPYPNPFNPTTVLSVQIPEAADVRVVMYSVLGQEVCVLQNGRMEAGTHAFVWNGKDGDGKMAASGVYFYRVNAGIHHAQGKVMFLR